MYFATDVIKEYFAGKDPFDVVAEQDGEIFKNKDGRRTLRFYINGNGYFLKHHKGIGWKEIIKNLLQLRLPILGAENEFIAINKLHEIGIDTMRAVACGVNGINPALQESFLITEEITDTINLEKYCQRWKEDKSFGEKKKKLLKKIAALSRKLHGAGINHRDFYLCHFLIKKEVAESAILANDFRCFLIDLHRVQIRAKVPERWLVKDLGALYFSAVAVGFNKKDCLKFLKLYFDAPLREVFRDHNHLIRQAQHRGDRLLKQNRIGFQ
jgi:heptose I phosphotransferase